jgi:hypothetical protein
MSDAEVQRCLRQAEECRQQAARMVDPREKQALLQTADRWTKLAQEAEKRSGKAPS